MDGLRKPRLESSDLKFTPNIPSSRRQHKVKPEKEEKVKVVRKPRKKQEQVAVASGPFALGPAAAAKNISLPTKTSTSTTGKVENKIVYEDIDTEEEEEELTESLFNPVRLQQKPQENSSIEPGKLLFFQFPKDVPCKNGKLQIRKSGKMTMLVGGIEFQVGRVLY